MSNPLEDLTGENSEAFEDGNYFLVTVLDLDVNRSYPFQFRYKYKDGTYGKTWSAIKFVLTGVDPAPDTPSDPIVDFSEPEKIIITWDGKSDNGTPLTDYERIDIYIDGAPFDGTKPTDSFIESGTKIIPAPPGEYIVVLYAVSKLGTLSPVTSPVSGIVLPAGEVVEPPTLPIGLSVSPAPFAVSVNWTGSYASSTFSGFKSVDIHVRGSDLGATATSGFSTTTQVATLTVTNTTNRQNIGLDNLRQALGLASNQDAYTAPMFFYYIARNKNDALYSVGGTPTYTRINSTSVNPIKANFVDLANGVISIENLVAGNGNFSSYLRVGSSSTSGGGRIEISGVNDFIDSNTTRTVKRGITAYDSGNNEVLRFDYGSPVLTINGSGKFTGSLEIGSGNDIIVANPLAVGSNPAGIWIGHATYESADFRVSANGILRARAGEIGGWALTARALTNLTNPVSFRIQGLADLSDPKVKQGIIIGRTDLPYLEITDSGIIHRNADGSASGKFTLTTGSTGQLSISGQINVTGGNAATTDQLANYATVSSLSSYATVTSLTNGLAGKVSNGGVASDSSFSAANIVNSINNGTTTINGGLITTGTILADRIGAGTLAAGVIYAGNISANQITAGTITGRTLQTGSTGARITISGSGEITNPNSIVFTNPGGAPTSHIVPMNIGGTQYGLLMHYGSTADASGGSYPQIFIGSSNVSISSRSGGVGTQSATLGVDYTGISLNTSPTSGFSNAANISFNPGAGGQVTFGTSTGLTMEYLASNGNLRIGGNITRLQADGQIFANTLGTSAGTTLVQSSSGFIKVLSSSRRYKENIVEINKSGYLNLISLLKPVTFNYKQDVSPDDYQVTLAGLIAEDVQEIENLRTLVNYNLNGEPESISYNALSALLVLAIKEIKDKLENIELRLDALEG